MTERDQAEELIKLKSLIGSVLISKLPGGMTLEQISNEFKSLIGYDIPHKKFGYSNLSSFLWTLTDILRWEIVSGGEMLFFGICTKETVHVVKLNLSKRIPKSVAKCSFGGSRVPNQKPVVPAIVRKSLSEIVNDYPNGLHVENVNKQHELKHGHSLDVNQMGFSTMTSLVSSLSDCMRLKSDTPTGSKVYPIHKKSLNYQQIEIDNLSRIIRDFSDGIEIIFICGEYKKRFHRELNYISYGYSSLCEMLADYENLFVLYRKNNEWYVKTKTHNKKSNCDDKVLKDSNSDVNKEKSKDFIMADALVRFKNTPLPVEDITDEGPMLSVHVTEVVNPHEIYAIHSQHLNEWHELFHELSEFYKKLPIDYSINDESDIILGQPVVVKLINTWYRAVVIGFPCDYVRLYLLDTGSEINVSYGSHLRFMSENFLNRPAMAFRMSLANVLPVSLRWSKYSNECLSDLLRRPDFTLWAIIRYLTRPSGYFSVSLIDVSRNDDLHVDKYLVETKGVAKYDDNHLDFGSSVSLNELDCVLQPSLSQCLINIYNVLDRDDGVMNKSNNTNNGGNNINDSNNRLDTAVVDDEEETKQQLINKRDCLRDKLKSVSGVARLKLLRQLQQIDKRLYLD